MNLRSYSRLSTTIYITLVILAGVSLVACGKKRASIDDIPNPEAVVTQQAINYSIVQSLNGVRQYKMDTPLLERHDMAREPFTEFPNGIEITTYDSIGEVESTMRANYAIRYERRELWEVRGNVVGHSVTEERTLRTEQLFWDEKMGRIYSNVNSTVEQKDGIHFGEGFESDEQFHKWLFRNYRGRVIVDASERDTGDGAAPGDNIAAPISPQQPTPVAPAITPATPAAAVRPRVRNNGEEGPTQLQLQNRQEPLQR